MRSREEMDQVAWNIIKSRPARPLLSDAGVRPLNYLQLEAQLQGGRDFELAWSDFLHAFYDFRAASFFTYPSPPSLDAHHQALLAGAAEWLSAEFGLPRPTWVDDPRYVLAEPWDPWQGLGLEVPDLQERLAEAPEPFRRRNISFEARDLIAI